MKRFVKRFLFKTGTREKRIACGLARKIKMKIDFANKSQRYLGLDEREIQSSFKKFAVSSSVFVDIGASDGYYGLIYYKWNKKGELYLCDADPTYAELQKNHFAMNEFSMEHVHFVSKFISNTSDENHVALDDLLSNIKGSIFIKIDVDGAELQVLKGMESTLKYNNCELIVETHSKGLEVDCTEYLHTLGYKTKIIPNAWWRFFVPEKRPFAHNRWFSAQR